MRADRPPPSAASRLLPTLSTARRQDGSVCSVNGRSRVGHGLSPARAGVAASVSRRTSPAAPGETRAARLAVGIALRPARRVRRLRDRRRGTARPAAPGRPPGRSRTSTDRSPRACAAAFHSRFAQQVRQQLQRSQARAEAVEDRALAELQVAVVARRQRQQLFDLGARRRDAGVAGAHQLDHVGVALVRHDRTAGRVLRRQRDETELGAGEQAQVPGQAAQVEHRAAQRLERRHLELAARQLRVDRRRPAGARSPAPAWCGRDPAAG